MQTHTHKKKCFHSRFFLSKKSRSVLYTQTFAMLSTCLQVDHFTLKFHTGSSKLYATKRVQPKCWEHKGRKEPTKSKMMEYVKKKSRVLGVLLLALHLDLWASIKANTKHVADVHPSGLLMRLFCLSPACIPSQRRALDLLNMHLICIQISFIPYSYIAAALMTLTIGIAITYIIHGLLEIQVFISKIYFIEQL